MGGLGTGSVAATRARTAGGRSMPVAVSALRVGIDVGGTFTKAVALDTATLGLEAQAAVPTTHDAGSGVTQGVVRALEALFADLGKARRRVELVAFSTTQAMNALLEGDVARVGVVGIGAVPDLRPARRRTRVGDIALAPGHWLRTEHAFLDASRGLEEAAIDAALEHLAASGCSTIAVSGAFAVDSPEPEQRVVAHATRMGLPACAGHELTGAYGLETRTVSAAINAAILPAVERTATLVRRGLAEAGVTAPLLVLRGDGGAMSPDAFRRRPSLSVGSGPAAGVAAALHRVGVADAIVVECGGTSTNVSVVKRGRPVLRSIKVMGRLTAIRSIDSWVVGAAGGSMPLLGRRRLAEVGPRSAHVSGLPYATFADPRDLEEAELELTSPHRGDPERYAVVRARGGRYAVTPTCAANALGVVAPGSHAEGSREAALAACGALTRRLRVPDPEAAARAVLDGALEKIELAVRDAARSHDLDRDAPLVALGGAAEAMVPRLAERIARPLARPEHPEVLSSVGAAISLIRTEVSRTPGRLRRGSASANGSRPGDSENARLAILREAERACVQAGAAPGTVAVETHFDQAEGVLRAAATGAVALEAGAAERQPVDAEERRLVAAGILGSSPGELRAVANGDFYAIFAGPAGAQGRDSVAVVDGLGAVPLAERSARVVIGAGGEFVEQLEAAVEDASLNLGITSVLPRVSVVAGPRLLDLSDARRREELIESARRLVGEQPGVAVGVVVR